jgi:3-methyladenine DNA glycosylase AlkD
MSLEDIILFIEQKGNQKNIEGMSRYGIITRDRIFGVSMPELRKLAKKIGKDHSLALRLWDTKIHEARILASLVGDYKQLTREQMDKWAADFDNWAVCDQVCSNLFDKTAFTSGKIKKWTKDKREFVRRAGFVMLASSAVHNKSATDEDFIKFFPIIKKYSTDERNFVKKAVNWAIRQIGKRKNSKKLLKRSILLAREIEKMDSRSARWIAKDAIRELERRI